MDSLIRKAIAIALPALMLFVAAAATGKTGDEAILSGLRKMGFSFGPLVGFCVLVCAGLAANAFSLFVVDGLLVRFYHKRRELEPSEKLTAEIDRLPITDDLKIKLKWTVIYGNKITNVKYLASGWFALAATIATLLSLTGYLGEFSRFFEIASHFKLQYLLVGLCALIFFAIARSSKLWLLVSICCIALNLAEILPWYLPLPASSSETSKQQLRILHSNVLISNTRYADAISMVREEKPDVAVFVEVTPAWAQELKALSDTFPYSFGYQESSAFGSAIYSKLPLKNTSVKAFSEGRKSLIADVTVQDRVIYSAIVVHPSTPSKEEGFRDRNRQLAALGEYADAAKNPVVIAGDFNITMWSPFYKNMVKIGGLKNARSGFGILPTWPTIMPLFYVPIDHFLLTKEISVIKSHTGRNIGSDHLPLIADLAI